VSLLWKALILLMMRLDSHSSNNGFGSLALPNISISTGRKEASQAGNFDITRGLSDHGGCFYAERVDPVPGVVLEKGVKVAWWPDPGVGGLPRG
jgi:hypothetical protein